MDKSWMETNRISKSYVDGVAAFTDYAVHNLQKTGNIDPRVNKKHIYIPCPCTKCLNHIEHKVEEVQYHLYRHGIDISYTKWTKHGEEDEPSISAPKPVNATTEFVDDMDFAYIPTDGPATVEMVNATKDNFDVDDLVKFQELLLDAEKPLYEGCPDFTKLSAIVKLLNLKGKYGASDKFFTELLGLIKKMLPAGNEMVEKTYQAKKVMRLMGSGYKKIHVCINNCLLYWKNDKDLTACRTCGTSRWKVDNKTKKVYENIPAKVMWYFPIIPRLQRLFKIESISEDLRWHATRRITDGVLRHPADSQAWRTIDEKFPEIAEDTRNLRLGISADGVDVNTGNMHHSVWPVLTVIYNLPPWLCMKRKFINLSVLISGYPGNDIDVFLEPLVDDLHTLFETGVDTYDASTKDNFNLCAVVLWTINDYPALGTLCGCPYSRFKGCVVCGKDTNCVRLSASSKESYVGHRRYLPYNHPFRKQKKAFNGQQEFLQDRIPMTEEQIYNEIQKQKRNTTEEEGSSSQVNGQNGVYWKKFNIWYRKLKYWRHNPVPHCIDFMHVEKNVVESIVKTLLHVPGKTKDGLNARLDLAELGVKLELFAMQDEDKTTLPPAGYTLTNAEKDIFCETLHNIKVIKGHTRNKNKPEGCIAEETIAEETIEFFSEYHKSMETIGIPPDKHETCENEEEKPLSADKSSEVSVKLFQKAHLYVIQNKDEIVPYIEHCFRRHKQVLKTKNPGKRIAFLENEHSKSFSKWLCEEVERELAIDKESVSETVRWISYGPRATVVKYNAYNINEYTFRTKCHDGKVYQNSGVSVEAIDLHISKEVATTRQAYYYGVLQEIWVLDYRFRKIPLFKCDWVNHKSGDVKRDKLGYTLVDLNNLGHKVDPFVLASQALKTRQSINVKSHIFNVRGDNDKTKQTPTRMSSVVRRSLKKETSTLGEIVSLYFIKSNKNVIGLIKSN
ncbi:putative transposase-associated domain-containing protein [Tanacetum coccineum]|uniref:Transposase-associated domain-containing protein n=1 Tax=Tanacetum coccineum TaxID=301880 RepID=A0ABQ5GX13_9ASTR